MAKELTIQLDAKGETLTVKSLVDALEKALALLRTLDANEEWEVVRVSKQSPLKLVVRSPNANRVAPAFMRNIRKFEKPVTQRRHPRLPDNMLVATHEFAGVLNDGFSAIKLSFPGERSVKFTPQVVQNVDTAAKRATDWYYEWTSVRGLLYQITWSERDTRCRIREALTQAEIPCVVSEQLLDEVKKALPHRVDLYGRAKCNRVGTIASIDVEQIRILSDDAPSISSLPPVDITGGMDATEYVERLRGVRS